MDQSNTNGVCKCHHHKVIPALFFVFGLLFLLGSLGVISPMVINLGWPILVMIGAAMKMFSSNCKCCARP